MEIKVLKEVLGANELIAQEINALLSENRIFAVNMMSSPGSGKTTILEKTIEMLMPELNVGVIAGDVATTRDAERLSKCNASVVQIDTDTFGGACHLEAQWVKRVLPSFDLKKLDVLFIENIGNLICPSGYNLGQHMKVVVVSVTEGEDKPIKYPAMFSMAHVVIVNKIDLLPHLDYDIAKLRGHVDNVAGNSKVFELSARSGEGMEKWVDWLKLQAKEFK